MLDFTALDKLRPACTVEDAGSLAIELEPGTEESEKYHSETPGKEAVYRIESGRRERELARIAYATYKQNTLKAGTLRSDIAKGIMQGEDPLALLLKALECIGLMTGEKALFQQEKEYLTAIYGWGLGEAEPLELELEEAKARLAKLTRPELKSLEPGACERIQNAIKAHITLIEELEKAINERPHNNA